MIHLFLTMLKFARRRARSSEREPVKCSGRVMMASPTFSRASSSDRSCSAVMSLEAPATPVRVESKAAVAAPIKLVFQLDRENEPATSTRVTESSDKKSHRLSGSFVTKKDSRTVSFGPMTSTLSTLTRGLEQVNLNESSEVKDSSRVSVLTPQVNTIYQPPPVLPRKPKLENFLAGHPENGQGGNVCTELSAQGGPVDNRTISGGTNKNVVNNNISGNLWKMELLDTSAESGYGTDSSDNNSLRSQESSSITESDSPPPLPKRKPRAQRRVKFDSYVMLIQALKDRDLKGILTTIFNVSQEALCTEDVIYHFHTAILRQDYEVTELLVRGGCDVNTFDHRGWSALHCACSLARLDMIKLLLQNGAAVLARTHHSSQIASQLLPPDKPGFSQCLAYLRCMEECLGTVNNRLVFAAANYRATRVDELTITRGDRLFVQRRGDNNNEMWWWCRNGRSDEGYVLRDLLALNSRHS